MAPGIVLNKKHSAEAFEVTLSRQKELNAVSNEEIGFYRKVLIKNDHHSK